MESVASFFPVLEDYLIVKEIFFYLYFHFFALADLESFKETFFFVDCFVYLACYFFFLLENYSVRYLAKENYKECRVPLVRQSLSLHSFLNLFEEVEEVCIYHRAIL